MDEESVKIGIVGTGNGFELARRCLPKVPGLSLAAVCHRDMTKAQACAEPLGLRAFSDVAQMVKEAGLGGVIVATPSGDHEIPTTQSLTAGAHVLCEKPLDVTVEAVQGILGAQVFTGKQVSCLVQNRFSEAWVKVIAALARKRLGTVTAYRAEVPWYRDVDYYRARAWRGTWKLDGGGALMNQAIHQLDLLVQAVQRAEQLSAAVSPFGEISGYVANLGHVGLIETEDTALMSMRTLGGSIATLFATTNAAPGGNWKISIESGKGTIEVTEGLLTQWTLTGEPEDAANAEAAAVNSRSFVEARISGGGSNPLAVSDAPRINLLTAWGAFLAGKGPCPVPASEGAIAVRTAIEFYHRTGAKTLLPKRSS